MPKTDITVNARTTGDAQVKKTIDMFKKLGDKFETMNNRTKEMNRLSGKLNTRIGKVNTGLEELQGSISAASNSFRLAGSNVGMINKQLASFGKKMQTTDDLMKDANKAMRRIIKAEEKYNEVIKDTKATLKKQNKILDNNSKKKKKNADATKKLTKEEEKSLKAAKKSGAARDKQNKKNNKNIGVTGLAFGFVGAAAGGMADTVIDHVRRMTDESAEMLSDLNRSILFNSKAWNKVGDIDFAAKDKLKNQRLSLAFDFALPIEEVIDFTREVDKAIVGVEDAEAYYKAVAKFAHVEPNISGESIASDLVTIRKSSQREVADIANIMFAYGNASKLGFTQAAKAMAFGSDAMRSYNTDLETFAAVMIQATNIAPALAGSAGRAIATMGVDLLQSRDLLEQKYNIKLFDDLPNGMQRTRDFKDVLLDVIDKINEFKKLGKERDLATFMDELKLEKTARRLLTGFAAEGKQAMSEAIDEIEGAVKTGQLDKFVQNQMQQPFEKYIVRLQNELKTMKLSFGSGFFKALNKLDHVLSQIPWEKFREFIFGFGEGIGEMAVYLDPLIKEFNLFTKNMGGAAQAGKVLAGAIGNVVIGLKTLAVIAPIVGVTLGLHYVSSMILSTKETVGMLAAAKALGWRLLKLGIVGLAVTGAFLVFKNILSASGERAKKVNTIFGDFDFGNTFSNQLGQATTDILTFGAIGAGIGAMGGPIGAAIGAGIGAGVAVAINAYNMLRAAFVDTVALDKFNINVKSAMGQARGNWIAVSQKFREEISHTERTWLASMKEIEFKFMDLVKVLFPQIDAIGNYFEENLSRSFLYGWNDAIDSIVINAYRTSDALGQATELMLGGLRFDLDDKQLGKSLLIQLKKFTEEGLLSEQEFMFATSAIDAGGNYEMIFDMLDKAAAIDLNDEFESPFGGLDDMNAFAYGLNEIDMLALELVKALKAGHIEADRFVRAMEGLDQGMTNYAHTSLAVAESNKRALDAEFIDDQKEKLRELYHAGFLGDIIYTSMLTAAHGGDIEGEVKDFLKAFSIEYPNIFNAIGSLDQEGIRQHVLAGRTVFIENVDDIGADIFDSEDIEYSIDDGTSAIDSTAKRIEQLQKQVLDAMTVGDTDLAAALNREIEALRTDINSFSTVTADSVYEQAALQAGYQVTNEGLLTSIDSSASGLVTNAGTIDTTLHSGFAGLDVSITGIGASVDGVSGEVGTVDDSVNVVDDSVQGVIEGVGDLASDLAADNTEVQGILEDIESGISGLGSIGETPSIGEPSIGEPSIGDTPSVGVPSTSDVIPESSDVTSPEIPELTQDEIDYEEQRRRNMANVANSGEEVEEGPTPGATPFNTEDSIHQGEEIPDTVGVPQTSEGQRIINDYEEYKRNNPDNSGAREQAEAERQNRHLMMTDDDDTNDDGVEPGTGGEGGEGTGEGAEGEEKEEEEKTGRAAWSPAFARAVEEFQRNLGVINNAQEDEAMKKAEEIGEFAMHWSNYLSRYSGMESRGGVYRDHAETARNRQDSTYAEDRMSYNQSIIDMFKNGGKYHEIWEDMYNDAVQYDYGALIASGLEDKARMDDLKLTGDRFRFNSDELLSLKGSILSDVTQLHGERKADFRETDDFQTRYDDIGELSSAIWDAYLESGTEYRDGTAYNKAVTIGINNFNQIMRDILGTDSLTHGIGFNLSNVLAGSYDDPELYDEKVNQLNDLVNHMNQFGSGDLSLDEFKELYSDIFWSAEDNVMNQINAIADVFDSDIIRQFGVLNSTGSGLNKMMDNLFQTLSSEIQKSKFNVGWMNDEDGNWVLADEGLRNAFVEIEKLFDQYEEIDSRGERIAAGSAEYGEWYAEQFEILKTLQDVMNRVGLIVSGDIENLWDDIPEAPVIEEPEPLSETEGIVDDSQPLLDVDLRSELDGLNVNVVNGEDLGEGEQYVNIEVNPTINIEGGINNDVDVTQLAQEISDQIVEQVRAEIIDVL